MKTEDLISRLNIQIAKVDASEIEDHIKKGDFKRWSQLWKIETAGVCFALYEKLYELERNLTWDELKEIILDAPGHEAETEFVKGLILGSCIKKMEEKQNELIE